MIKIYPIEILELEPIHAFSGLRCAPSIAGALTQAPPVTGT